MQIFEIAIIGSGPVGLFAAFQAGMQGISSIILETLDVIGGQCSVLYPEKFIYDIPGWEKIKAKDLILNLEKQCRKFESNEILLNSEVTKINSFDQYFNLELKNGNSIYAKTVIIAVGNGSFMPNKPSMKNLNIFEEQFVHYLIKDIALFENKTIAIAGGGDSAVDWALMLADIAKKIYFIHRRHEMRCHPHSLANMQELVEKGIIEMKIPYIAEELIGDEKLERIVLKNFKDNNDTIEIESEYFLPFFGLKSDNSNLSYWGISTEGNKIPVGPNMQTNAAGIYAIGDICNYIGKTKLLVSGFHEASVACNSVSLYLAEKFNKKTKAFSYSSNM